MPDPMTMVISTVWLLRAPVFLTKIAIVIQTAYFAHALCCVSAFVVPQCPPLFIMMPIDLTETIAVPEYVSSIQICRRQKLCRAPVFPAMLELP
jgi:hypothetical protein